MSRLQLAINVKSESCSMKLQKLSKIVDISNEIFLKGKINLNLLLLI